MVDHDPGPEPERGDEDSGTGPLLGSQADEGDPFCLDQPAGSGPGAFARSAGALG